MPAFFTIGASLFALDAITRYDSDMSTKIGMCIIVGAFLLSCRQMSPVATTLLPQPFPAALVDGPWEAGVADGPLFAPLGLSMGGYGFRVGPLSGRNRHLGASQGRYQTLVVKAVALSNGHGLVVLTKVPLIFVTDLLRQRVVTSLGERTGLDFNDALVLSATHTHSGPARFWAMPDGVGVFGLDDFDPAVLDGLAESIADVVEDAYRRLAPARFGADELWQYDPLHEVNRDRRSHNDNLYTDLANPNVYVQDGVYKSKDQHLWVARIEDERGRPLAALVRLGIHGTVFADMLYTEDAPGMIERAVEQEWDVPVAMFLQGATGDVSPAGGDNDREGTQVLEAIAVRVARVGKSLWDSIVADSSGTLAVAHTRRQLDRQSLGYADDEFGKGYGEAFQPYAWGGFFCGELGGAPGVDNGDPGTMLQDGQLGCLGVDELQGVISPPRQVELPLGELSTAVVSAVRLGDWTLATLPGEPVSQMDSKLRDALALAEVKARKLAVLGYAQAHLLYLTPAEDWHQGGYEAAQNIWGWRLGDFLIAQLVETIQRLDSYGSAPAWTGDARQNLPREAERREQLPYRNDDAPRWLSLSATTVERLNRIAGGFYGGDSWIDPARIELVPLDGGTPSDNSGFGWRLDAQDQPGGTHYRFEFEPGLDILPGVYRFRATGRYADRAGNVTDYSVESPDLSIVGFSGLIVTGEVYAAGVSLNVAYPPHPVEFEPMLIDALDRRQLSGFRMLSDDTGPNEAWPITAGPVRATVTTWPGAVTLDVLLSHFPTCNCLFSLAEFPPASTGFALMPGSVRIGPDIHRQVVWLAPN